MDLLDLLMKCEAPTFSIASVSIQAKSSHMKLQLRLTV
jgi:hypothetical protein